MLAAPASRLSAPTFITMVETEKYYLPISVSRAIRADDSISVRSCLFTAQSSMALTMARSYFAGKSADVQHQV